MSNGILEFPLEENRYNFDEYSHINATPTPSDNNNFNNTISNNNDNEKKNYYELSLIDCSFFLKPIEAFAINKHLPSSFKLESEDVFQKYLRRKYESSNHFRRRKRKKKSTFRDDASSLSSHEDPNILLKRIPTKIKNDNTLNILKQVKKERYYIQLRCEQIVEKIKKHKMEYIFHSSSSLDSFISNNKLKKNLKLFNKPQKIHVTLKKIYKKVVNREYHTIYELGNDLRNLWSYFFKLFADVPKLYRNIYIMNEYCEQLIHDIEKMSNIKLIQRNKNGITNLPFEDGLKRSPVFTTTTVPQMPIQSNNISNIQPLTEIEKKVVVENIKLLTQEQLNEIIQMVNDAIKHSNPNNTFYEFDIESLPVLKQRQLYNFVYRCSKQKPKFKEETRSISTNEIEAQKELERVRKLKVSVYNIMLIE